MIDLRSDTVTLPTREMKNAMQTAPLGDDVFVEDPSINALEEKVAAIFGKEKALFCPSGTMTNQIAIRVHVVPGDEVICSRESHVYCYEGGGIASNSGASVRLIEGESGILTAGQIEANINSDDVHFPKTSLVCLENTSNRGGGVCYEFDAFYQIKDVCVKHGLALHLDGARVYNAIVRNKEDPKKYGSVFDSISVCLSKGLGAPVGSVLLGSNEFIKKARRVRKAFGGGMRQAGMLAAAASYALDNHVERLAVDHDNAQKVLQAGLKNQWVAGALPVETNIVVLLLKKGITNPEFLEKLNQKGILAVGFGPQRVRLTMHLDVSEADVNTICETLLSL
jgi:threonine aldolase